MTVYSLCDWTVDTIDLLCLCTISQIPKLLLCCICVLLHRFLGERKAKYLVDAIPRPVPLLWPLKSVKEKALCLFQDYFHMN
jgi:hypothetical protein